ncbi:MAG TPA: CYTH and CHAD domain-containing protein [Mycobacterium sp.]|nr:CYTH and CHAD domain-containing protein [Mycobacterium sp.]
MPKPARYKEIERKYDVDDSTVSPSFDGIAAIGRVEHAPTEHLDAVYFDTPGQDLARNKVTLRRRTGGTDAGWHLKLPAGADARTEVRLPLDGTAQDTVPADLVDVVLAIVRDRPLAPVARISTTREVQLLYTPDGRRLAEFCDDRVRAYRTGATAPTEQRWREWELELLGDPDDPKGSAEVLTRVGNRLLDAGAQSAAAGSKLARVLDDPDAEAQPEIEFSDPVHRAIAEQVGELVIWDRAVRADAYDSVHQMRVITRKLRSLLKESEESFGLTDDSWVLDELRQLAAILGVARDAEVLAEKYQTSLDALPAELIRGPVRERLVDGARRRYDLGLRRSLAAMRTTRYFRLLDALEALASAEPVTTEHGEEPAPVTIDAAYKRVRKAAKVAHEAQTAEGLGVEERDEALHRIRKGAKRLRYTASATGEPKVSDAAKTIQTLLGDHQDSVVSRTHLSQQAEAAHAAGEDTFTYGVLYQHEDDLAQAARSRLDAALHALAKAVRKAT